MLGAMNSVLSNENHTNDKNTTAPSYSLSVDAVTVTVTLPWVRYGVCTLSNRVQQITIRDDIAISIVYCMPGATNYVLTNGNNMNDNNKSTPFSFFSAAAVAYPLVNIVRISM